MKADSRFHIEVAIATKSERLTRREVALQAESVGLLWTAHLPEAEARSVAAEHLLIAEQIGKEGQRRGRTGRAARPQRPGPPDVGPHAVAQYKEACMTRGDAKLETADLDRVRAWFEQKTLTLLAPLRDYAAELLATRGRTDDAEPHLSVAAVERLAPTVEAIIARFPVANGAASSLRRTSRRA